MVKPLKVGVVRFPGSNCYEDTLKFFQKHRHVPKEIWHKNSKTDSSCDLLVLPGGFAFGDRIYKKATEEYEIKPGTMALQSPVMEMVRNYAERKKPILGICNGFQILANAGLLPGKLERNTRGEFYCDYVSCRVTGNSFFGNKSLIGKIMKIPVAHGYGKYSVGKRKYGEMTKNEQIFLEYVDNPNGSCMNIAGVCNEEGNIFGMMPHPERADEKTQVLFIKSIEEYVA